MKIKKYKRLTFKERGGIQTLLEENKTKSFIANKLYRSRSTITREINKWMINPYDKYDPTLAYWLAKDDYLNKKINTHKRLKFFVYKGLLQGWSPDQISGRLRDEYPNDPVMSISYQAIYIHIYRHRQVSLNKKLSNVS